MNVRDFKRLAWRCIKAYIADEGYEALMDDATVEMTGTQWHLLLAWLDVARDTLNSDPVKIAGANPVPLIRAEINRRAGGVNRYL